MNINGRPPLYTDEQVEHVLGLHATGLSLRGIAARVGISKSSVHSIVQKFRHGKVYRRGQGYVLLERNDGVE